LTRPLYLTGGVVALGLGFVGLALPLVPQVPFFVVAAFCFARSRPEWEQWMLDHAHLGPLLRDWHERRAVSRKVKWITITGLSAGVGFTWLTLGWPWVLVSAALLVVVGTWVWTRPE
jgi:uncharacterized membrane protein YbaN (DUF454 family)